LWPGNHNGVIETAGLRANLRVDPDADAGIVAAEDRYLIAADRMIVGFAAGFQRRCRCRIVGNRLRPNFRSTGDR